MPSRKFVRGKAAENINVRSSSHLISSATSLLRSIPTLPPPEQTVGREVDGAQNNYLVEQTLEGRDNRNNTVRKIDRGFIEEG